MSKLIEMNYMKIAIKNSLLVLAAAMCVLSCKNKEEETLPSLDGSPAFRLDPYYKLGDRIDITPGTVNAKEGVEVRYAWKISSLMDSADTSEFEDGRFSFVFDKDTTGSFTVSCTAFADGYYSSTGTAGITLVKAGLNSGSIQDVTFQEDDGNFWDERPGQPGGKQSYYTTTIGEDTWFKQNLAYTTTENKIGLAYLDCEATGDVMGRFYSWEEAMKACPDGWRLPAESDFLKAAEVVTGKSLSLMEDWKDVNGAFMVYASFNGDQLWEYWPAVKVSNDSGFSALSFGWCNLGEKKFQGVTKSAAFWTADEVNTSQAVYRYMVVDKPYFYRGIGDKENFGASVRCIKIEE